MSSFNSLMKEGEKGPVVFFDFDGTLTTGDTLMPFLKFLVGSPVYYLKLLVVSPIICAHFAKLVRNDIAKELVLKFYLSGYHIDTLCEYGDKFGKEFIPNIVRAEGIERLRSHREQGHDCVLVSASMDVYLKRWAESQGFCDVLCTSLKVDKEGVVSGEIDGRNCYGKEKLKRIISFLGRCCSREKYAYGDSPGDHDMLGYSDHAFYLKNGNFVQYLGKRKSR